MPSDSLLLSDQSSHPLDVIRNGRDIRVILLILGEHKSRVDVNHDNAINLMPSRSNLLDDIVGDVAADVVEVPGSRVRPDDGRPSDLPVFGEVSTTKHWGDVRRHEQSLNSGFIGHMANIHEHCAKRIMISTCTDGGDDQPTAEPVHLVHQIFPERTAWMHWSC